MPVSEQSKFGIYDVAGWFSLLVPAVVVLAGRLRPTHALTFDRRFGVLVFFSLLAGVVAGILGLFGSGSYGRMSTRVAAILGMWISLILLANLR
jgi:hypothetical protein